MRLRKLFAFLLLFQLVLAVPAHLTGAQGQETRWSKPARLSSQTGQASEGYLISDEFGFVHVFWTETGVLDNRIVIQYSRFDGQTWSAPNDIYIARPLTVVKSISPAIDKQGNLHIVWVEGIAGPVKYSYASLNNSLSANAWSKPISLDYPAFWTKLEIDSKGVLHILYSDFYGANPGMYHIRSFDQGVTWSAPYWLDPDNPTNYIPQTMQFAMDENDGLHALWELDDLETVGAIGKWVRYAHSLDGGDTWSTPVTIDVADENQEELRLPHPELAVFGDNVHVVWAGTSITEREHRYSSDRGENWSPIYRIWGDLHGQGLGGGLEFDARGRVHYIAQVRWPQGIYHGFFDGTAWSNPSMIYLIAMGDQDPIGNRIHAHNVRLAIRAGNQLVTTFTTAPQDPQIVLYAMHRTLEDVSPLPAMPTPVVEPTPTRIPIVLTKRPTPTPLPTLDPAVLQSLNNNPAEVPSPAEGLFWGVVPALILSGILLFSRLARRR